MDEFDIIENPVKETSKYYSDFNMMFLENENKFSHIINRITSNLPDHSMCVLAQKLQLLKICIQQKIKRHQILIQSDEIDDQIFEENNEQNEKKKRCCTFIVYLFIYFIYFIISIILAC